MNSFRRAFGAGFTIPAVVISLFALIFAAAGCEVQDLEITESSAPVQGEVSFSAGSQSSVPANPPAWNPDTLYNRAGMYVSHKGRVWVSQWEVAPGAEPGANAWNGWKSGEVLSRDPANPKPWDVNSVYNAEGFYVSHKGKVWVSQWYITRGREPGANTWNGWKETGPVIDPVPAAKPTWAAVSARGSYTLAINSRGELYAWGWNHNGKLGDGTTTNRSTPTRIGSDSDWGRLSQGGNHSMAVKTNGELYAWGPNDEGQLGDGTTSRRLNPTRIGDKADWKFVTVGYKHSLAINSRGELYAWGRNYNGQLGDGTTEQRNSPVRIGIADNWTQAAAGNGYSLALNGSGELFSWGKNFDFGEAPVLTPARVGTASDWAGIGAGHSSYFAIKTNGDLYAWGSDSYGQLGNGDIRGIQSAPVLIDGDSDWTHVSGWRHTLARGAGGELYAWGANTNGQLGDGTRTRRNSPLRIGTAADWLDVSAGSYHSAAVNDKGELYAWGLNDKGQLGDGTTAQGLSLVKIAHP